MDTPHQIANATQHGGGSPVGFLVACLAIGACIALIWRLMRFQRTMLRYMLYVVVTPFLFTLGFILTARHLHGYPLIHFGTAALIAVGGVLFIKSRTRAAPGSN